MPHSLTFTLLHTTLNKVTDMRNRNNNGAA